MRINFLGLPILVFILVLFSCKKNNSINSNNSSSNSTYDFRLGNYGDLEDTILKRETAMGHIQTVFSIPETTYYYLRFTNPDNSFDQYNFDLKHKLTDGAHTIPRFNSGLEKMKTDSVNASYLKQYGAPMLDKGGELATWKTSRSVIYTEIDNLSTIGFPNLEDIDVYFYPL